MKRLMSILFMLTAAMILGSLSAVAGMKATQKPTDAIDNSRGTGNQAAVKAPKTVTAVIPNAEGNTVDQGTVRVLTPAEMKAQETVRKAYEAFNRGNSNAPTIPSAAAQQHSGDDNN